jgi:hypothetical protein
MMWNCVKQDYMMWNCGKCVVFQCEEGGDYKVIFCDQGDTEVLPLDRLHPFPQEYSEIPMLAIECELAHVQPRGAI